MLMDCQTLKCWKTFVSASKESCLLMNCLSVDWFVQNMKLTQAIISSKKIFLILQKSMNAAINHAGTEPPASTELTHSHVNVNLDFEATGAKQVSFQVFISRFFIYFILGNLHITAVNSCFFDTLTEVE